MTERVLPPKTTGFKTSHGWQLRSLHGQKSSRATSEPRIASRLGGNGVAAVLRRGAGVLAGGFFENRLAARLSGPRRRLPCARQRGKGKVASPRCIGPRAAIAAGSARRSARRRPPATQAAVVHRAPRAAE